MWLPIRVELVDSSGRLLHQQSDASAGGHLSILVAALAHGQYWVRVYDPAPPDELLREFGLRVE